PRNTRNARKEPVPAGKAAPAERLEVTAETPSRRPLRGRRLHLPSRSPWRRVAKLRRPVPGTK
ncbi:MAG: hypothetical protein IKS83_00655, partial [Victivallales bacterium]|nr:hypothetical protein [Victivallales bacterium]